MADRCAPSRLFSEGIEYEGVGIPYAVGRQMARSWCGTGANVRLSSDVAPLHVGGSPQTAEALPFFEARFAGIPQLSSCWLIWPDRSDRV